MLKAERERRERARSPYNGGLSNQTAVIAFLFHHHTCRLTVDVHRGCRSAPAHQPQDVAHAQPSRAPSLSTSPLWPTMPISQTARPMMARRTSSSRSLSRCSPRPLSTTDSVEAALRDYKRRFPAHTSIPLLTRLRQEGRKGVLPCRRVLAPAQPHHGRCSSRRCHALQRRLRAAVRTAYAHVSDSLTAVCVGQACWRPQGVSARRPSTTPQAWSAAQMHSRSSTCALVRVPGRC
jgi:hypothetical protein